MQPILTLELANVKAYLTFTLNFIIKSVGYLYKLPQTFVQLILQWGASTKKYPGSPGSFHVRHTGLVLPGWVTLNQQDKDKLPTGLES